MSAYPEPGQGEISQAAAPLVRPRGGGGGGGGFLFDRMPELLVRAGRQSFWPLADQGVVSAGNFLTLVFVARALPAKSEYGVFGLLLECIFYFNTLQSALVTYPLTMKGAVADDEALRRLASASLLMTLIMSIPVAFAGLGAAALSGHFMLGLTAAFALVAWQAQDVVRKSLIARFRYAEAVLGDALRYLGTAACVWVMWRNGRLGLINVFVVIGVFATLAMIVQSLQIGPRLVGPRELLALSREFWVAGRWMLLTSASAVLVSLCGVWTLKLVHGSDVLGDFYAVVNFTKPINPILMTFGGLVVQHAARAYDAGGIAPAKRAALRLSAIACALTIPYLALVIAFPGFAMRVLYGADSHFHEPTAEFALRLFALGFTLAIALGLIGSFLNGVGRTRDSFYAQAVNSVATLAIALPMTIYFGLLGMILGGAAAAVVQLVAMVYFYRRAADEPARDESRRVTRGAA